jgi:plastocyanin
VAGYLFARSWQSKKEAMPTSSDVGNSFRELTASRPPSITLREGNSVATPSMSASVSPSATPSTTASKKVKITITDTDFSPSTVSITKGTTVTFVNDGQGVHWPQSSEFDSKHVMQTGETFSYQFSKVGEFTYEDHLNDSLKGTIIVK